MMKSAKKVRILIRFYDMLSAHVPVNLEGLDYNFLKEFRFM